MEDTSSALPVHPDLTRVRGAAFSPVLFDEYFGTPVVNTPGSRAVSNLGHDFTALDLIHGDAPAPPENPPAIEDPVGDLFGDALGPDDLFALVAELECDDEVPAQEVSYPSLVLVDSPAASEQPEEQPTGGGSNKPEEVLAEPGPMHRPCTGACKPPAINLITKPRAVHTLLTACGCVSTS